MIYNIITAARRSIHEEMKPPYVSELLVLEPKPLPVDPLPFDLVTHSGRYRRQSSNCHEGTRHVLFMLDTSGSIGAYNFNRMTSALSTLVHYFCKPTKIAVMTFSDEHFIEFCFNCFDNDCEGRDNASDAMWTVHYRGGLTHTGAATECACDRMLRPECGFPDLTTSTGVCLDVIYVTDGMSNDPRSDPTINVVCEKVQCLYDLQKRGVDLTVYAFGITNYNDEELDCITRYRSTNVPNPIFKVHSFQHFTDAIEAIGGQFDGSADNLPDCFTSDHMHPSGTDTDDCSESRRK